MEKLYSWAAGLTNLCSTDEYSQFFENYFFHSDSLLNAFFIALAAAIVLVIVFYFVICKFAFKFANRLVWILLLVLSGVITFFSTDAYLVGKDGGDAVSSSGIISCSYVYVDATNEEEEDMDRASQLEQSGEDFRQAISTGEYNDTFYKISGVNAVYSIAIFFLLSVGIRKLSENGKYIPF